MKKLVMISLDALYDADLAFFGESTFIGQLLRRSAVSTRLKTIFPAVTYPTHTTMVTGVLPARHGVENNRPFQPEVDPAMRRWYWDAANIRVPTLFDAVKSAGGTCAAIFWPVTGRSRAIRWNLPEVMALPGENQVLKILRYGSAGWILTTAPKYLRKVQAFREPWISDLACDMACDVIRHHQPDLTAVHFVDLDEKRHHHGTDSPEARAALARMDDRVRRVWEAMQSAPGMEDALLVILSDHGQADTDHPVLLADALAAAGVPAQVQSCGMSAYVYTDKPDQAAAALASVGGVSHVYDRVELDGLGCPAEIALAVEAAPGVVFADNMPQAYHEKATHGYGPGHPAERCLFAASGTGIHPGELPEMPMTSVAPTVAGLMGVVLPGAEGVDLSNRILTENGEKVGKL
ncbi:MAG: alkaline phosphatase family protein [Clostridia bacterium]|nr:alkaline phosphatase family protein [Clostridia bacterium]